MPSTRRPDSGLGEEVLADLPVRAVRTVAWARLLVAVCAAIAASLSPDDFAGRTAAQVLTGAVWVPWAGLLALAAERSTLTAVRIGGAASDLLVVFAVHSLLPGFDAPSMVGYVLAVVGAAYTSGRAFRVAVAGGAIALAVLGWQLDPFTRLDSGSMAAFALAVGVVVLVIDRTSIERSRAEAQSALLENTSSAILDHVADAVVITDGTGVVGQLSRAAQRTFDCPATAAMGARCDYVVGLHLGERALDCSAGCPLLASGATSSLGLEVWRHRSDGTRQPLLANVSAITSARGEIVHVVHSLRDITRVKEADEAKTIFLATASHELKTPLTVIGGFAQTLLADVGMTEREREAALRAIARRADELGRIVNRLLLSSRIEAGGTVVSMAAVDVEELLRERVDSLTASTGRRVELHTDPALAPAMADPDALVTVLDHLLDNAVKYSPDGGPILVNATGESGRIVVSVSDRGVGMDAVAAERCFERFWQADAGDARRFGGTGIGLYIVRSLVEAMQATIEVESALGRGSTFRVVLRDARAAPDDPSHEGERSMVREFMRQIGVPGGAA